MPHVWEASCLVDGSLDPWRCFVLETIATDACIHICPHLLTVDDANRTPQVEEEEEEDEDDEEGGGVEWTLRKCSAAGLDVIANHYRDDILEALLPHIHTKLTHSDWKVGPDLFLPFKSRLEAAFPRPKPRVLASALPHTSPPCGCLLQVCKSPCAGRFLPCKPY